MIICSDKDNIKDKIWIKIGITIVLALASIVLSFVLDIEFNGGVFGLPYVVGGPVVIALHILSFIGSLIVLLLLSININRIRNINLKRFIIIFA